MSAHALGLIQHALGDLTSDETIEALKEIVDAIPDIELVLALASTDGTILDELVRDDLYTTLHEEFKEKES